MGCHLRWYFPESYPRRWLRRIYKKRASGPSKTISKKIIFLAG
jgi:hypothetical protein